MVPAVLRAGHGVEIEVDPKSVFARPFDRFQEIGPRDALEVRLVGVLFNGPEPDGEPDPVEARTRNLREVLFSLQWMKMSKREKGGGAWCSR